MNMMFDQLSAAITNVAKDLGGRKKMTEQSLKPALRDVRRALLDADVNVGVADGLIEGVLRRSVGQEVTPGVTVEQQFVKLMYDELLDVMGGDSSAQSGGSLGPPAATLARSDGAGGPAVVLLAGLQGAGKTTVAGKLGLYLREREVDYARVAEMPEEERTGLKKLPTTQRKVLLVAADVYRPAAVGQLQTLGETVGVDVFSMGTDADPVVIAQEALVKARLEGYDTVLVDTAGRQVIDTNLMDELRRIKEAVKPSETLLVVDAMTGQEAASLTASFDDAVGLTGAILTKLDGDSRGGAAVSVRGVSGRPIKFVGTGERVEDLEPFFPDRLASRVLGMGDVVSLVEKAAAEVSEKEAQEMQKKMLEAKFDFDDFLKQTSLVNKMGSFAGVANMLPGVAGSMDKSKMREVERRLKKNEAMINSMTKKERANPELLLKDRTSKSRITRITKGSGTSYEEGAVFMSEFQKMRTMMSRMQKQMGQAGDNGPGDDPNQMPAPMGNRSTRRKQKKKKGKTKLAKGFGV